MLQPDPGAVDPGRIGAGCRLDQPEDGLGDAPGRPAGGAVVHHGFVQAVVHAHSQQPPASDRVDLIGGPAFGCPVPPNDFKVLVQGAPAADPEVLVDDLQPLLLNIADLLVILFFRLVGGIEFFQVDIHVGDVGAAVPGQRLAGVCVSPGKAHGRRDAHVRILGGPTGQLAVGLNRPLDDLGRVALAGDKNRAGDQPDEDQGRPSCVCRQAFFPPPASGRNHHAASRDPCSVIPAGHSAVRIHARCSRQRMQERVSVGSRVEPRRRP